MLPANELAEETRKAQGYIWSFALKFKSFGVEVADLVQEGNLGLLEAAQRFDKERGIRFLTYAGWWIRAYVLKAIEHSRNIRTTDTRKVFWKGSRVRAKLESAGLEADAEAVAQVLGVTPRIVETAWEKMQTKVSLDKKRTSPNGDDDRTVMDRFASPADDELAEAQDSRRNLRKLLEALETLPARDRDIVNRYHLAEKPETLTTLAKEYGISRERCRQLGMRAVARLRKHMETV